MVSCSTLEKYLLFEWNSLLKPVLFRSIQLRAQKYCKRGIRSKDGFFLFVAGGVLSCLLGGSSIENRGASAKWDKQVYFLYEGHQPCKMV